MSNSERLLELRKEYVQEIETLWARFQRFPLADEVHYAELLAQIYYLVRHTPSLLATAAGLFGPERHEWHEACIHDLRQEQGHSLLAIDDLKRMGWKLEDLAELPQTVALYAHQYYRLQFCGPVSMWGYSLMVEGLAALRGDDMFDIVERAFGTNRAVGYLRVHARVDKTHFDAGLKLLENITDEELRQVRLNLKASTVLWCSLLDGIEASAKKRQFKRAA